MKVVLRSAIAIIYILSFLVILHNTVFAQAPDTMWTRTFGDSQSDRGRSIDTTFDGGYVITGYTESFGAGQDDVWLIKTNYNGNIVWTKTFGGSLNDQAETVETTSDSGYIIAGWTESYGAGQADVWLIKTDAKGDTLWTKTFGHSLYDQSNSVKQTSDGGYIIVGTTNASSSLGGGDVWLIKTNANGDSLWTKTFGDNRGDWGYSVQQTRDSGYIITGFTNQYFNPKPIADDVWLIKTDENGDTLWTKTYGGKYSDGGYSVLQTMDGGYVINAYTRSFGAGLGDVWLIRTDENGDTLWTKTIGGSDNDGGYSIQETSDGGYIIAGETRSFSADDYDVWLIKTNANGDTMWTKTFGGVDWDGGYSVQNTSDGGCIITGFTGEILDYPDVWLIKVAPVITTTNVISHNPVKDYRLQQNYPNPFNPSTTIEITLPKSEYVELKVYNILGKEVSTLVSKKLNQGKYTYTFEGKNLASGVYYYQLVAGEYREVKKMILLK